MPFTHPSRPDATVSVAKISSLPLTVMIQKVTSLEHKSFNDSMKGGIQIARGLLIAQKLAGAELPKIFARLGALGVEGVASRMRGGIKTHSVL